MVRQESGLWRCGVTGRAAPALVIDCHTRELPGRHLSRSSKAATASSALERALARFGTLGRVPEPFLLRSDSGLMFTRRSYAALVRSYGLRQEFITPISRLTCAGSAGSIQHFAGLRHSQIQQVYQYLGSFTMGRCVSRSPHGEDQTHRACSRGGANLLWASPEN
ncbi:MAG: transposase family protein [Castellaniella sp.]|uniref:integrase catalytic domain-containing protein n=1 Tax=Castellaniella sp. TaxID=1955812 RepID=UPI003C749066